MIRRKTDRVFDENRYDYDYNRNEIEKCIEKLCAIARETDMPILPFICDIKGKYSEKKTMRFINGIVKSGGCEGKEAEFYKAFLYCSIRCYANSSMSSFDYDGILERLRLCSTFQDILNRAKLAEKDSRSRLMRDIDKLMLQEYEEFEDPRGPMGIEWGMETSSFFIVMDKFYVWLTGETYKTIDSERFEEFFKTNEDYIKARNDYDEWIQESVEQLDKNREAEALANGYDSYEEYREAMEFEAQEAGYDSWADYDYAQYWESMSEEEIEELEKAVDDHAERQKAADKINEQNLPAWNKYREEFSNVEKFIEMYRKYRKLFFEVSHTNLYNRVESMIYSYMYENKLSLCIDDEAVLDEVRFLDDLGKQLENAIRRSRSRRGI